MTIGAIVRANHKGLGYQTRDFASNFPADVILWVLTGATHDPDDLSFLDGQSAEFVVTADRHRRLAPAKSLAKFVRAVDVVFSAETLYEWEIADLARAAKAKTVVQGNPEFYVHGHQTLPAPDRWIWPTSWMTDVLPDGPVIPCPVTLHPELAADPFSTDPLRVLHVAGKAASGDRNGTLLFMEALRYIQTDVVVTVVGQDGWLPESRPHKTVELITNVTGVDDRWEMYRDQHVMVLPRRYGGNCLPANEACAAGLALVMPLVSPNQEWPIVGLDATVAPRHLAPFGRLPTYAMRPQVIAGAIDRLNRGRDRLAQTMMESRAWAQRHTWDALRPAYTEALTAW